MSPGQLRRDRVADVRGNLGRQLTVFGFDEQDDPLVTILGLESDYDTVFDSVRGRSM